MVVGTSCETKVYESALLLHAGGWEVASVVLREKKIGTCAGDFFCWIRTPGVCNVDDDNHAIAKAVAASDLVVYLTPITFGGTLRCSSAWLTIRSKTSLRSLQKSQVKPITKSAIPRIPIFWQWAGWTRPTHSPRLSFDFSCSATRSTSSPQARSCGVVLAAHTDEEILAAAQTWVRSIANGRPSATVALPQADEVRGGVSPVRRAVLLVGSPKTRKSTSHALSGYLFERLSVKSIHTETIHLHTVLRSPEKMKSMLAAVEEADLVVLAFPLYVDSLPAPVIESLECIVAHQQNQPRSHE